MQHYIQTKTGYQTYQGLSDDALADVANQRWNAGENIVAVGRVEDLERANAILQSENPNQETTPEEIHSLLNRWELPQDIADRLHDLREQINHEQPDPIAE